MSGSSTFRSAVERASRLNVWKTKPISRFRTRASRVSSIPETSCPRSQYSPALGVSRQPSRFISVDFPEPDGPTMATYSFASIVTDTSRRACTTSLPTT